MAGGQTETVSVLFTDGVMAVFDAAGDAVTVAALGRPTP